MRSQTILSLNLKRLKNNIGTFMLYSNIKSNKHPYLYLNNNHLLNGFFRITALQQRNNRALPIFIKLMRSLNDKRVNKLSSRISLGISNILVCIKFDIISRYCKTLSSFILWHVYCKGQTSRKVDSFFKRLLVALCLCQMICFCFDIIK